MAESKTTGAAMAPLPCLVCGGLVPRDGRAGRPAKVCSTICKSRRDGQLKAIRNPRPPKRKGRTVHDRTCVVCGVTFGHLNPKSRCCSVVCVLKRAKARQAEIRAEQARQRHARTCERCGVEFAMRRKSGKANAGVANEGRFCSRKCRADAVRIYQTDREAKVAEHHRRRARKNASPAERFSHLEVFDRNDWRCGLCGESVSRDLRHPHPMSASLDHIVPLSKGGAHTRANSQCAHLTCNVRKGAGDGAAQRYRLGLMVRRTHNLLMRNKVAPRNNITP